MFYLFTGNKLEILAEKYREHIYEQPVSDPMYDEVVVVQTQGMAAYLKQYLARHSGIAAQLGKGHHRQRSIHRIDRTGTSPAAGTGEKDDITAAQSEQTFHAFGDFGGSTVFIAHAGGFDDRSLGDKGRQQNFYRIDQHFAENRFYIRFWSF